MAKTYQQCSKEVGDLVDTVMRKIEPEYLSTTAQAAHLRRWCGWAFVAIVIAAALVAVWLPS